MAWIPIRIENEDGCFEFVNGLRGRKGCLFILILKSIAPTATNSVMLSVFPHVKPELSKKYLSSLVV